MFPSGKHKSMPGIGVLKAIIGSLVADVYVEFSVAGAAKRKTSKLVTFIDKRVVKTVASFLIIQNKNLNSDLFY